MTAAEICPHRLSIITGHYGTGKTEFAVNLALSLAAGGERVMLADLDIVNPYFRSRERRQLLEAAGIRLVATSQACTDADIPAIPAELLTILEDRSVRGVLDIGGTRWGPGCWPGFSPRSAGRTTSSSACSTPTARRSGRRRLRPPISGPLRRPPDSPAPAW